MAAASAEWYYIPPGSSNKPFGPLTYTALAELVKHGTLPQDALVWHAGLPEWRPWNSALQETPLVEQLRQSEQARPAPSMQTAPAKAIVASTAKPADPEDALASFMGEISAIEVWMRVCVYVNTPTMSAFGHPHTWDWFGSALSMKQSHTGRGSG